MKEMWIGFVLVAGCTGYGGDPQNMNVTCVPKSTEKCLCADHFVGHKICNDDGRSYSGCECDERDGGYPTLGSITCATDCNPQITCLQGQCGTSGCEFSYVPDGTVCTSGGTSGVCTAGGCCLGCVQKGVCVPGTTLEACGYGGHACHVCDDGNPCNSKVCMDGGCAISPAPNGTACPAGVCFFGVCQPCGGTGQLCCAHGFCYGSIPCDMNTNRCM